MFFLDEMRGIKLFWYVWYTKPSRQKSTDVFTYLQTSRYKYANELLCMVWCDVGWGGVGWWGVVWCGF